MGGDQLFSDILQLVLLVFLLQKVGGKLASVFCALGILFELNLADNLAEIDGFRFLSEKSFHYRKEFCCGHEKSLWRGWTSERVGEEHGFRVGRRFLAVFKSFFMSLLDNVSGRVDLEPWFELG